MPNPQGHNLQSQINQEQFESVLKGMLSAMTGKLGERFLTGIVKELCEYLPLDMAAIGHWKDESKLEIQTLAVYLDGNIQDNFTYLLKGSPCETVFEDGVCCYPQNVQKLFPQDKGLVKIDAESYIGIELKSAKGEVIGIMFCISHQRLEQIPLISSVIQIFSYRVAAELERQQISQNLQEEVMVNQAQLDAVPALMFMLDEQGKFLRWNKYFKSKFGYSRDKLESQSVLGAVHDTDKKRLTLELENILTNGSGTMYLNGVTREGESVPLLATAQTASYEGKRVIVGVALDMTEQQNVERNLLRSQGRLARKNSQLSLINALVEKLHASHSVKHIAQEIVKLLRNIHDGALVLFSMVNTNDRYLEIIAASGASEDTINARRRFPIGDPGSPTSLAMASRKLEVFKDIQSDSRLEGSIKQLIEKEEVKSGIVIPLIYADEPLGGITIGFHYASDFPADEIEFYQTIGTSVSLALSNARQFEVMENLATCDTLTGLPNRNMLNQECQSLLATNKRSENLIAMILVDLDRFKEINDTLDHQIGDRLLQQIGPRLSEALANEKAKTYRLGGDEFCVLLQGIDEDEEAEEVAALINLAIAKPFEVDGLNLEISSSIGIVVSRGDQRSENEMLRCAELAMYQAKSEGGGIHLYTPDLDADTNQRFVIMAEMAEAIRNDELTLHYQPKFDLVSRRIIGCEALVRWQHKHYGLIQPTKFIPLVELTQLIHPLTHWVMKSAMSQMNEWKKSGLSISVAINLSTRNLADADFIEQVDALMHQFNIEPKELEFEVTETALMSNLDAARKQLSRLSKRGIQCSLDDYGTGYSSLTYIKNLPLDNLKIDRSFISKLTENDQDRVIAHSTINLAHSLGLKVIAEGVEDEDTLHELARQGCDFIQGYYISEPLDPQSFAKLYWNHA